MDDWFDPGKERHYLQYLDANNLYGWAMVQKLFTVGFEWMSNPENLKGNISELVKDPEKGYLLEFGVPYPQDLHDLHSDFLFMCEKRKINRIQKLVPNLYNKNKYIIHMMALNQALQDGLILQRIHQAIDFDQSAWLEPYINFNTQLIIKARNDFEKDFFKLMNNSVFKKTIENIRNSRTSIS